jgi:molybdenum cofactor cytidylyltransferase
MADPQILVAILAAGASRRLGQPKQLVMIDGEPLIRRQCRVCLDASIGPVAIILGCCDDDCAQTVADLPIEICDNFEWREGMAASLRCAAELARVRGIGALLLLHCDQYRVTSDDLRTLHAAWTALPHRPCVSRWDAFSGPPVIVPARYYNDILDLHGDRGAREVIYHAQLAPQELAMANAQYDLDDHVQLANACTLRPE